MDLPRDGTSVYAVYIREAAPCRSRLLFAIFAPFSICAMSYNSIEFGILPVLLAVLSLLAALVLSLFSLIRQGRGR